MILLKASEILNKIKPDLSEYDPGEIRVDINNETVEIYLSYLPEDFYSDEAECLTEDLGLILNKISNGSISSEGKYRFASSHSIHINFPCA